MLNLDGRIDIEKKLKNGDPKLTFFSVDIHSYANELFSVGVKSRRW
jgi:hypothetical protein